MAGVYKITNNINGKFIIFGEKLSRINKGKRPSSNTLNAAAQVHRRFTDEQIKEIRNKRSKGVSVYNLAISYKAGYMTIYRILTGKTKIYNKVLY